MPGLKKDGTPKKTPGPRPDTRPEIGFRVEESVYLMLSSLQPTTGQTADQVASLLLHVMLTDPQNAVNRLNAILGSNAPTAAEPPTLLPRKNVS